MSTIMTNVVVYCLLSSFDRMFFVHCWHIGKPLMYAAVSKTWVSVL